MNENIQEEAILEIKVYFNPEIASAESVASELDAILDNAMSTMGIMDGCGDPEATAGVACVSDREYAIGRAVELRRQAEAQCARAQRDRDSYKGIVESLVRIPVLAEAIAKIVGRDG